MKVSIIMCSYNGEEFIERAIESVLAQTYTNWELIICDDQSKDRSIALIEQYTSDPRIRLIQQPQNLGYVRNKNFGFSQATGELLTQLDSDDTSPPERIAKQVQVFLDHPEINICGTNYQQVDTEDAPLNPVQYPSDFIIEKPGKPYPFWYPGLMFRVSIIQEFGLFSEYFDKLYGDDKYWTLRVNSRYPIYFIKDILYNYRINPNSITNVLDNPRKLIVNEILEELLHQIQSTGTTCLEQGNPEQLRMFEQSIMTNKTIMAEKYRIWAAKAIDKRDMDRAKKLLLKSLSLSAVNTATYKTAFYYLRKNLVA